MYAWMLFVFLITVMIISACGTWFYFSRKSHIDQEVEEGSKQKQSNNNVQKTRTIVLAEMLLEKYDPVACYWWQQQMHRFDPQIVVTRRSLPSFHRRLQEQITRNSVCISDSCHLSVGAEGQLVLGDSQVAGKWTVLSPSRQLCPELLGYEQHNYHNTWACIPSYPYHLGEGLVLFRDHALRILNSKWSTFMGSFGYSMAQNDRYTFIAAPGEGDNEWGQGRVHVFDHLGTHITTLSFPTEYRLCGISLATNEQGDLAVVAQTKQYEECAVLIVTNCWDGLGTPEQIHRIDVVHVAATVSVRGMENMPHALGDSYKHL